MIKKKILSHNTGAIKKETSKHIKKIVFKSKLIINKKINILQNVKN